MEIKLTIHKKDFPNVEMSLFSKIFPENSNVVINFYETDEKYEYETRNIYGELLLATKTGVQFNGKTTVFNRAKTVAQRGALLRKLGK